MHRSARKTTASSGETLLSMHGKPMPLNPDKVNEAVEYLRTLLAKKKENLRRTGAELDYTAKRDAVLAVKERYPGLSDDQLHDVMQRADE
jgi:hypothetical protein